MKRHIPSHKSLLKEAEKEIGKGHLGQAKRLLFRTFLLLDEKGLQAEKDENVLSIIHAIHLAEEIQRALQIKRKETLLFLEKNQTTLQTHLQTLRLQKLP